MKPEGLWIPVALGNAALSLRLPNRDHPVERGKLLSKGRVGGDELGATTFSEGHIKHVGDRMVIEAAGEIPGAIEISRLVTSA